METLKNEQLTNIKESRITVEEIEKKRQQILKSLEKVRCLSDDWKSTSGKTSGKTKAEVIEILEQSLLIELNNYPTDGTVPQGIKNENGAITINSPEKIGKRMSPDIEAQNRFDEAAHYLTIGDTHIPVCNPPKNTSKWQAISGKVFVSGGKKFSDVKFVKDQSGLTQTAKPGESLSFSEKHRGERLETVDTVLEGRGEIRAFNEVLELFGKLESEYENLNPDEKDYDQKAKELAEKIAGFIDAEKLKSVINFEQNGIENKRDFTERVADMICTVQFLRSLDENMNEFIPLADPSFKLTPYFEKKFAWFASLINRQLGLGNNAYLEELINNKKAPDWEKLSAKGMSVIVGPRGTGKNKLVDFYCASTNRPLFRYTCSPTKEESDLTYDVKISDGEAVRIPSRVLTAATTPNAVLEIDEINVLRPNIAKFFNSLFDGDRTIFMDDQVIKAAPGTVFVGLMNPSEYAGVEDLPETIDDRSNIIKMDYPPFREIDSTTNQERFTYDEALILKENITPLKGMSDEQFIKAWDYVINGKGAQISLDSEIIKILKDVKNIVAIADRTRQTVAAYKTRTGDTRMERDISLRGTIEAARLYSEKHLWNADLSKMPEWQAGWNAAKYAVAATYFPHTETYKRGRTDKEAMSLILAEEIK